jgi:peptidoglycan/LPS O-acetylase OafA/YrhL
MVCCSRSIASDDAAIHVKPTLEALDGLRGVGAICIVLYHFFSGFTPTGESVNESIRCSQMHFLPVLT